LPDVHEMLEAIGVARAMVAVTFVALSIYLLAGLFKLPDGRSQRPVGTVFEWIESFLLPDEIQGELAWSGQLQQSLKRAAADKKLVFVDFTAIVCTNCRYNEATVFSKPDIIKLLSRYVLVKLYTDGIPTSMGP